MNENILFCDIDGCLTPSRKIWTTDDLNRLDVAKEYSDHDANMLTRLQDRVVFVSADKRINKEWAEHKGIHFIHAPTNKFESMHRFWLGELQRYNWTMEGDYFYLGDSLPDFEPLSKAKIAFTPLDLCPMLAHKMRDLTNHRILMNKGGDGLLALIVLELQRDHGIWTDLEF